MVFVKITRYIAMHIIFVETHIIKKEGVNKNIKYLPSSLEEYLVNIIVLIVFIMMAHRCYGNK